MQSNKLVCQHAQDAYQLCNNIGETNHSILNNLDSIKNKAAVNEASAQDCRASSAQLKNGIEDIDKRLAEMMGHLNGVSIINLDVLAAKERLGSVCCIDVRRPDEWNGELGHIEGCEFLTIDEAFKEKLAKFERSKPYLFVCRSGGRSARAAQQALGLGFTEVYNMEGGMLAWNEAKLPVKKDRDES